MYCETKTLLSLHQRMNSNQALIYRTPIFADIRVFSYPILLIALYCTGMYQNDSNKRYLALYTFTSAMGVFAINYIVKIFISKQRPYHVLDLETPKEELFLTTIPTDSFPSDHAGVSAAIAASLLFRGIKNKQKKWVYFSIPFWLMCLSMALGRIMIGIHRPSDIIVGVII